MLVVHPSIPVNSVAEFVAYAKTNPVTYAHGGNGSPGHLSMEYFRMHGGFPATPVPYRGNAQLAVDLVAGQIKFGFVGTGGVIEHVRAGHLKGLAISSAKRSPLAPDIPTIAEAGYDFVRRPISCCWRPPPRRSLSPRCSSARRASALQSPDLVERFRNSTIDFVATSGAEAKARLEADTKLWAKVVEATGMHVD